jgi:hypothetical protein
LRIDDLPGSLDPVGEGFLGALPLNPSFGQGGRPANPAVGGPENPRHHRSSTCRTHYFQRPRTVPT